MAVNLRIPARRLVSVITFQGVLVSTPGGDRLNVKVRSELKLLAPALTQHPTEANGSIPSPDLAQKHSSNKPTTDKTAIISALSMYLWTRQAIVI